MRYVSSFAGACALLLGLAATVLGQSATPAVTIHVFTKADSERLGTNQSVEQAREERQKAVKEIVGLLTKGVKTADVDVPPSPANGLRPVDKAEDAVVLLEVLSNGRVPLGQGRYSIQVREVATVLTAGTLSQAIDEQSEAEPAIAAKVVQWVQENRDRLKR